MKRNLKIITAGVLFTSTLMFGFTSFADSITKSIEVTFNSVNLKVNGKAVAVDNILYNGTTYAPIRAVSEMLGKEVGWDGATNTASINDKSQDVIQ